MHHRLQQSCKYDRPHGISACLAVDFVDQQQETLQTRHIRLVLSEPRVVSTQCRRRMVLSVIVIEQSRSHGSVTRSSRGQNSRNAFSAGSIVGTENDDGLVSRDFFGRRPLPTSAAVPSALARVPRKDDEIKADCAYVQILRLMLGGFVA